MNISPTTIGRSLLSVVLPLLLAGNAAAETMASTSTVRLLVTCGDVQGSANKWWAPFVEITIDGRPANLASLIDQRCRGVPPDTLLRLPVSATTPNAPSNVISIAGMGLAKMLGAITQ